MNLNSDNQCWSFWEYRVYPDGTRRPDFALVKANCARFGRLMFGSTSEMKVRYAAEHGRAFWEVAVLTEGHPVHDPAYTEWMHRQWQRFFHAGFGPSCELQSHARLAAGDRQDGTPADQLIMLPSLELPNG